MIWTVEAWRGVAAWLVVWAHWAPALGWVRPGETYAFVGVDIFFVLSGFVFGPALFRGIGSLGSYLVRRALRIYPAYALALLLYVLLAWRQDRPLLFLWEHVFFLHVQSREMAFYYNPAFWSLPSEVEYYALLPLLAWCTRRWQEHALLVFLSIALGLRLALLWASDGDPDSVWFIWAHHLPGTALEFFFGAAAWYLAQRTDCARVRWRRAVAGAAVGIATVFVYAGLHALQGDAHWHSSLLVAVTAAGFAWFLSATCNWQPETRWLRLAGWWAGRLSYAIYLLHMAWLVYLLWMRDRIGIEWSVATATLGLVASAALLHWGWEEPIRQWARRQR
ncbi:acyltransferase family protein [Tepidimonas charontis]|uniref:Acyltransferase family protein n=1 Tax=Tepidimonas charontis TaxID=2267262 RepID=A0A554XC97_9BURK|nr:acyltransferase [Tepidimonas charontis]TSE33470.1 Acyltransferase family protein [Tepidimonas charontis]